MSLSKYAVSRLLNAVTTDFITSESGPLAVAAGAKILGLAPPCPRAGACAETVASVTTTNNTTKNMDRFMGLL
jgi:hypothetical protein